MEKRRSKPKKDKANDPIERLKWEIAHEIGLGEKLEQFGWGGLSSAETGRVGGIMTKRMREEGYLPQP
ncbi:MAG: small, acid-soluble spore protein, alpha/beta type [Bacillota bacterium]